MAAVTAVRWRTFLAGLSGCLLAIALTPALPQTYPAKPIRLLVPFVAGGSSDALARGVAKQLGDQLGVSVVVENRPGAGGTIAANAVAKDSPDGHVLLFATIGSHGISPALYKNLPYHSVNDFAAITLLHRLPNVLIVNSDLPVHSVSDLIAHARANPGKLTFASAGNGSVSHLAGELFKAATGIEILHVPYKGGGAAMPDVISGRVSMMFETSTLALNTARTGKVRAIAVTSKTRWPAASNLPTIAESGVPNYQVDSWTGLLAPAATPRPVVERLNAEMVKAARDASYRDLMQKLGVEAISSTPEEFRAFMQAEIEKWSRAVEASGAKVD
jgi:tripartite-type tricarboxylate transporter receptor subunit TctC